MKTRSLPSLIVHYLKIGYVFGQDISDLLTKVRPYKGVYIRLTGCGGLAAWGSGVKYGLFFIWSNKERHVLQYNKKQKQNNKKLQNIF